MGFPPPRTRQAAIPSKRKGNRYINAQAKSTRRAGRKPPGSPRSGRRATAEAEHTTRLCPTAVPRPAAGQERAERAHRPARHPPCHPEPEPGFCEHEPTDAYCFSRHSYSAICLSICLLWRSFRVTESSEALLGRRDRYQSDRSRSDHRMAVGLAVQKQRSVTQLYPRPCVPS
jgi:hypothetical protein